MHPNKFTFSFVCGWIAFHHIHFISAEIFTSMDEVQALVATEVKVRDMARILQKREQQMLTSSKQNLEIMQRILSEIQHTNAIERYFSHPPGMFSAIFQFTVLTTKFWNALPSQHHTETYSEIIKLKKTALFPSEQDLNGTAEAFHRLQETYKIYPEEIANGNIPGIRRSPLFTYGECFIVGYLQAREGFYGSAAEWLRISLERLEKTAPHDNGSRVKILDWLQLCIFHHSRNITKILQIVRRIKELDPNYVNVDANLKVYEEFLTWFNETDLKRLEAPPAPFAFGGGRYEALCRGENNIGPLLGQRLQCYYENHKNPFLLLQPVKVEVVHRDPDIYVLHNIILESQLKRIKTAGQKHLERASVVDVNSPKNRLVTKSRTSKAVFLEEKLDPAVAKVNTYSGQATNLNSKQSELLQLNNYGIGGHYSPHHDHMRKDSPQRIESHHGDRIATLLIYMSDVEAGGATVFPVLNLTLFPEKGSAAFWYNLFLDGTGIDKTFHAGCPVLTGSKWVSNKWFKEVQQDVTRPCGLQPDSINFTEVRPYMLL